MQKRSAPRLIDSCSPTFLLFRCLLSIFPRSKREFKSFKGQYGVLACLLFSSFLNRRADIRRSQVRNTEGNKRRGWNILKVVFNTSQREMCLCSHKGCVVFVPLGLYSRLLILAVVMEAYKVCLSGTVQGLFPVRPLCWSLHFCPCICHGKEMFIATCCLNTTFWIRVSTAKLMTSYTCRVLSGLEALWL